MTGRRLFTGVWLACVLALLHSLPAGAQPVMIGLVTDADTSATYPGKTSKKGRKKPGLMKSDLTAAEKADLIEKLNTMLAGAIGADKITVVPLSDDPTVARKIFITGAGGDRGETSQANKEVFVNGGTILQNEPAKSNRARYLDAVLFTTKHEIVHLISGLSDSAHGWEVSETRKARLVKEVKAVIEKQEKELVGTADPARRQQLEALLETNRKRLAANEALTVTPVNTFTDGKKITDEEVSDPASQTFSDRIKKALLEGVANIVQHGAPQDAPIEQDVPGQLVPLRGPNRGATRHTDRHPSFSYTIESLLLGDDLVNPALLLGLEDVAGNFIPFEFALRDAASDPLMGLMTLEAGRSYDMVLFDSLTSTLFRATGPHAQVSFDPVLAFDTRTATRYNLELTGDYYATAILEFDLDLDQAMDAIVTMQTLDLLLARGGDGFISPFQVSTNPNARAVPEPAVLLMVGAGALGAVGARRPARRRRPRARDL
jgi:hypothetical protein